MSRMEICLWLTQAPNSSMEISRNKGATKKVSRKMVHDNVVLTFWQKVLTGLENYIFIH